MIDFSTIINITPSPFLSALTWIVLLISAMYFARRPFHRSMASFSRIIYNAMRLTATSVKLAEKRLQIRNREVLLATGLEQAERRVEREFDRINVAVERNLEGYPKLQRETNEKLLTLEEDYRKSAEIPQSLPDWAKVIDAIANIKPIGDPMVINMLEDIHQTLNEQHKGTVERHRRDVAERHQILSRMLPLWRSLQKTIIGLEKSIANLMDRAKRIDHHMETYETIRDHSDMAERQLSSSSLTQFFISGLVLLVALGGAVINFNLIALPMSEMVGGNSFIGSFKTADVAGMVIICLEICTGLFLMESLRITRLFPIIGSMDDRMRIILFWVAMVFLTILAGVESALAFMRDQIAADMEALRQTLAGVEQNGVATSNIPTIGQMVMGFILPFILTFVAIPLESFIQSTRTLLGLVAAWALRGLAFSLRLVGSLGFYLGRLVVNGYDLIIFPAIWLEGVIKRRWTDKPTSVPENVDEQAQVPSMPMTHQRASKPKETPI
jgi:hypothetical protein